MRFIIAIILNLLIHPLYAKNTLIFKNESVTNTHWFSYGLVLALLVIIVLILAKYSKHTDSIHSKCKVIEKINIHNKTKIFVIDYQGQQFLIADNQNALSIQPLPLNSQS